MKGLAAGIVTPDEYALVTYHDQHRESVDTRVVVVDLAVLPIISRERLDLSFPGQSTTLVGVSI